ncbi:hypothetical protein PCURB6_34580 [Paenibacillus curdlanolyticus]|nr:hypothetical protein PCURB6_34580 [Paenibacillus curdlanolyticus]
MKYAVEQVGTAATNDFTLVFRQRHCVRSVYNSYNPLEKNNNLMVERGTGSLYILLL